jgi:3-deoxy-D-manno-octulosonate 8-phosphate phosphatase (KDO 8-P phosphatase)|tara:strand:+ start:41 stop:547 length:507 start_codon:yes stop_codon:yes gene_type:complete
MKLSSLELRKKCALIKLVITDVDGVLTDGGMYYSNKGDIMKKFHARDGMGVTLLRKQKIPTIIITKEKTAMVREWSKKMSIDHLYDGIQNKSSILPKIIKKYNIQSKNIAFIGDDVNDVELLQKVGLSATPNDAIFETIQISDYICKNIGGNGAFRELSDLILSSKNS